MTARIRPVWQWLVYIAALVALVAALILGAARPEVASYLADVAWWPWAAVGLVVVVAILAPPARHLIVERVAYPGWPREEAHAAHLVRRRARAISDAAGVTGIMQAKGDKPEASHPTRFGRPRRAGHVVTMPLRPPGHGITADTLAARADQIAGAVEDALARTLPDATATVTREPGRPCLLTITTRDLLAVAPDATTSTAADRWLASVGRRVPLGVDEHGEVVEVDVHRHHTIVTGATRAGKSSTVYGLLAGASRDPLVTVVGLDASGLTLAPIEDAGQDHIVTGTAEIEAAVDALAGLVALMDARIASLRAAGVDSLTPSASCPTVLVVLEEYAGLLAACEAHDAATRPAGRLKSAALGHVGRLLREGAKVGVLVWCVIQRPDASVIGGGDRSQYARRITHRLDTGDGVRMLNPDASVDVIQRVMSAAPGVGLLAEAGEPLRFVRSAHMTYAVYRQQIASHYVPACLGGDRDHGA